MEGTQKSVCEKESRRHILLFPDARRYYTYAFHAFMIMRPNDCLSSNRLKQLTTGSDPLIDILDHAEHVRGSTISPSVVLQP